MVKALFIIIGVTCVVFLATRNIDNRSDKEPPIYMQDDSISRSHATKIKVSIHSIHHPDSMEIAKLKKDYSDLWGHLNHLYSTNDVKAGVNYYTEDWFKYVSANHEGLKKSLIIRKDLQHELHIMNWSQDGLVCCAIDSNVVFKYKLHNGSMEKTKATIAMVLLFQGRNWRVDAMRILNERDDN